jgi:putative component of toxin-antitoxin plasmid stabilization module
MKNIPFFGEYPVSKQVISLQNDRGTKYEVYLKVQNELLRLIMSCDKNLQRKNLQKTTKN